MGDVFPAVRADAGLGSISATVTSLPLGYTLGDITYRNNRYYRLVFNAGNSEIPPGFCAAPLGTGSINSVTISTAAGVDDHVGAGVCDNATVATSAYFWMLTRGVVSSGLVASAACVVTGEAFQLGANGNIILMPESVITGVEVVGYAQATILSSTSGGGRNGSAYVSFM